MAVKLNTDKVGVTKRPEVGVRSSGSTVMTSDCWADYSRFQNKIARIYMPQKKHLHCHPCDKTIGKYWAIDFATASTYRAPLMQWSTSSLDPFYSKGDNFQAKYPSVNSAIDACEMMGWGYEVTYPHFKNHTKKSYNDNFLYKGEPQPVADYD